MSRAKRKAAEAQAKAAAQAAARRRLLVKAVLVGAALALAVIGLPILLVSVLVMAALLRWPDRLYSRGAVILGIIPAGAGVLLIGGYWPAYAAVLAGEGETSDVVSVLVYGLAFGPILGGLAARSLRKRREAHPLKGQVREQQRTRLEDRRKRARRQWVQQQAFQEGGRTEAVTRRQATRTAVMRRAAVPLGSDRGPYLGAWLRGDLTELQSRRGRYVELPWTDGGMGPHLWIAGQSGSGKSEIVHRLIEWTMENQRGQVLFINGKQAAAGKEASRRLLAHAEQLGQSANVLVPGSRPYDFMRGSPAEVRNRLMDIEVFSEPHHKAGTTVTLAFALHKLAQQGRPAAELGDVLRELIDRDTVKQWAAVDPFAAQLLDTIDERSWAGTVQRYAANAMDLAGWAGPPAAGGFALDDAQVTAVDLPTDTEPEAARMLLRMLLADLSAYLVSDRRPRYGNGEFVPLLVVVEELSAVDSDPIIGTKITNMMERMRSARGKMMVVTQDWDGLGEQREQNAVGNQSTVITCRQAIQAEEFASLAGTRKAAEASGTYTGRWQAADRAASGTLRMQEQFAVHPNEVRELALGECLVFRGNRYAKCAVTMSELAYGAPASAQVTAVDAERARARAGMSVPDATVDQRRARIGKGEL